MARSNAVGERYFSHELVATFTSSLSTEHKKKIQTNVENAAFNHDQSRKRRQIDGQGEDEEEDDNDNMLAEISQWISYADDPQAFIMQMVVLCLSIMIGLSGIISHVVHYCKTPQKKEEENAVRNMLMLIFFDFIWPILGVYPAIYVWFEYRTDDKLMYDPIMSLIYVLLYFAFIKLILFAIKVAFIEMDYRNASMLKRYPIVTEIFLEYDVVGYLLCDGLELMVVYFYSSRFMAPENDVNIANFWIPTFQFFTAFVPGVYHIYVLIKNFTVKKRNNRKTRKQNQRRATLDGQSVGTIGTNDSNFFRFVELKLNIKLTNLPH